MVTNMAEQRFCGTLLTVLVGSKPGDCSSGRQEPLKGVDELLVDGPIDGSH